MKTWWNKLERFTEGIGRGRKIALNLSFIALFLLLIWMRAGCPLPTAELEFRRLERTSLAPPGEIVFAADQKSRDLLNVSSGHRSVYALDGTELHMQNRWFVSLGEDWAAVAVVGKEVWDRELNVYPLEKDGPTLLTFLGSYGTGYWVTETLTPRGGARYDYHNFTALLLVNVPEAAEQAEITLQTAKGVCTGPGWNLGGGVWLLTPDSELLDPQLEQEWPYTVSVRGADGVPLWEQDGIFTRYN